MTDTLTSRQIIQKPDILVDPNFHTPPGVTEARPDPEGSTRRLNENGPKADAEIVDEPWSPGGLSSRSLFPPTGLSVDDQRQSYNADGTFAIDATLSFSDVPGATRYEVRLAKR